MPSVKVEQPVNAKLGKSTIKISSLLKEVYGTDLLSGARIWTGKEILKWKSWRVEDDSDSERPCTSKTDSHIEKVDRAIQENRRLSIRTDAELAGVDKENVRQILEMLLKSLTLEQKEVQMNIRWRSEKYWNGSYFLESDNMWRIIFYSPETMRQLMHWKGPGSPQQIERHA